MSKNIVSFGLKNVKYSKITITDGVISYGDIKPLRGAQELTADMLGGSTSVYGDDYALATFNAFAGRTIALKLTELSDDFKVDILGYELDDNNNLVEVLNPKVTPFALAYEVSGDQKKRRVWYYFCTAAPVGEGTKSNTDSIEANSITLNITSYSLEKDDKEYLKVVASEGDENYDTFFDEIPEVVFNYTKYYQWNPTENINTNNMFSCGSLSSISGYTYGGKTYSKGTKITGAGSTIDFTVPSGATRVDLMVIGYSNSTTNKGHPILWTNRCSYVPSGDFNLKDNKELKSISFIGNLQSDDIVNISKGNAEIMVVDVILTLYYS